MSTQSNNADDICTHGILRITALKVALTIKRVITTEHKGAERGLTKDKLNQTRGTKISRMKQRERVTMYYIKKAGKPSSVMHNRSVTASRYSLQIRRSNLLKETSRARIEGLLRDHRAAP